MNAGVTQYPESRPIVHLTVQLGVTCTRRIEDNTGRPVKGRGCVQRAVVGCHEAWVMVLRIELRVQLPRRYCTNNNNVRPM